MEIVKLPTNNLANIPEMLEKLAQRIRNGECGPVLVCAVVLRSSEREPAVLSFGAADSSVTFETLHLGAACLLAGLDH